MHKWLMKLTVVATLALVVAAIVAGAASARIYLWGNAPQHQQVSTPATDSAASRGGGTVSLVGGVYPKGTQVAPALGTRESGPVAQHTQTLKVPAASDSGFTWSDARIADGIGFGALCVLTMLAVGLRRSRVSTAHA